MAISAWGGSWGATSQEFPGFPITTTASGGATGEALSGFGGEFGALGLG